jgi:hypothetical protein
MTPLRETRYNIYFDLMYENVICHNCIVRGCCSKLCDEFKTTFKQADYEAIRELDGYVDLIPGKMFWNYEYRKRMMEKLSIK